jgi:hypothetical protein
LSIIICKTCTGFSLAEQIRITLAWAGTAFPVSSQIFSLGFIINFAVTFAGSLMLIALSSISYCGTTAPFVAAKPGLSMFALIEEILI